MELRAVVSRNLPAIAAEFEPLGIKLGPQAAHNFHKTHAANGLHLVPLSGGVFQLMVELEAPTGALFEWNLVDLEADWKTAVPACHPKGRAFDTVTVTDANGAPERGLRLLSPAPLREDLNPDYQPAKSRRRELKRRYWDWAVARHVATGGGDSPVGAAAATGVVSRKKSQRMCLVA